MRIAKIFAVVYLLLCGVALALIPASALGWFGMEEDPLSAVFAVFLALPWSALASNLGDGSTVLHVIMLLVGMALNAGIILGVGAIFRKKKQRLEN